MVKNIFNAMKKNFWYAVISLFTLPYIVFGQGSVTNPGTGGTGVSFPNPIPRFGTFMDFVQAILQVVLKIGIPVAAIFIIYSGFLFVKAQGNEAELTKAKSAFTYAVIGTAILLGSWLLATGIESTINSLQ